MPHDLTELARVGRVLEEAHSLLEGERTRLERHYGRTRRTDVAAGSPAQTLQGVASLADALAQALKWVALAAGYRVLGLDRRADHALGMARREPVSFPSGADRMARPLGEATVRAMELVRDLGFFEDEVAIAIDVALAAPQATYPPADWSAYTRETMWRARFE
ncbi:MULTISPECIES: hypothetical protein [Streptomyces]|uniref:Uncharacterized protein n=1 Tax=Streptomyces sudanensis TaxID=436397 RepID=A0ABY4T7F7_9ACTN|nr:MULTISPECIES: hypothetical protein [Streptomyces]MCP9957220.1 hypothetical protein [Streptomyces sudanensis]MCP9986374.1 hypothetical protein [Streptomyces sudanensis]MCQ0002218.1 hypothetical protein [Streptomyces sudanensis]URN14910.1 hypothetical protein MW084_02070 [Streptomyces sudanensis]